MKKVVTFKGAVMTWQCDSNRHMNVMYYVHKYEHAGRIFVIEMGLTKDFLDAHGYGVVVLEQNIKYLREVYEDDCLIIESSLLSIGNKAFTVFHEMYLLDTRELVSSTKIVSVLFDKTTRKAMPFPSELKRRIEQKMV